MKTRTERILEVLNVLAWVAYIGLAINIGAILISYGVSTAKPETAKNLYRGLDLYALREFNFWHYTATVVLMVILLALKVQIACLVIRVLSRIKLSSPFTRQVSGTLARISYFIFALWAMTLAYNGYTAWLSKKVAGLHENWISEEFILLAGVVFVFSQVFKKGVEIQSENELTV